MKHLRALAQAGLTHVHLLPVVRHRHDQRGQVAAGSSRPATWRRFPPDSEQQQAARRGGRATQDGFNWGYDPLHYTVPEGSYATDPDGAGAHPSSSARWCRASTQPACAW